MVIEIKESVEVAVIFSENSKEKPVWFKWRHTPYKITKVFYSWSDKNGRTVFNHYSVTDGINAYHLCYNTENLKWRLIAIDDNQDYQPPMLRKA